MGINLLITINNQEVPIYDPSSSPSLKIITLYPTINWDFDILSRSVINDSTGEIISQEDYGQYSYEIRISDNDVNIGSDAFIGNMKQTGEKSSQNKYWVYNGKSLRRGNSYYGQIRVTDESGRKSDWKSFSFYYNSLPFVDNVKIIPSQPSIDDDLRLSYDFNDDDGDIEDGSLIRWFKNGSYQKQHDNSIFIDSQFLQNNDKWMADICPSDGWENGERVSSPEVIIKQISITVSDIKILPVNPNENDILKVDYICNEKIEKENVSIRWYINDILISDFNNKQFIRPDIFIGDTVRSEVKHESESSYKSSSEITITSSDFIIKNILIEGRINPLDVSSVRPSIKWESYIPQDKQINFVSIKIGTFYEADNIYSNVLNYNTNIFTIPDNLLQRGRDYFISIAASDVLSFGDYSSAHFRITGSRWENNVDNSIGWTIETLLFTNDISTEIDDYHVIRINDGSYFAELKIRSNKISFISQELIEYNIDLTKHSILTITGKLNDIKIYINRNLIIDATGKFIISSTSKRLEFGCPTNRNFNISYKYFVYTVSGYFLPGEDEEYSNIKFHNFMEFPDNEIIALTSYQEGKYLFGTNPDNVNENSIIYVVKGGTQYKSNTVNRTFTPINRINISPDNKKIVCAHSNGVTVLNSYVIKTFDKELIFIDNNGNINNVLPENDGWELVQNSGYEVVYFDENGFNINTLEK